MPSVTLLIIRTRNSLRTLRFSCLRWSSLPRAMIVRMYLAEMRWIFSWISSLSISRDLTTSTMVVMSRIRGPMSMTWVALGGAQLSSPGVMMKS